MTSQASDVIVYGASGYTGKLIAESLHVCLDRRMCATSTL